MPIRLQVLGKPRKDNALLATLDSGSGLVRLMFDCGHGCPDELVWSAVRGVEHLFFSHFHLDHVCGFDSFFRVNYDRPAPPVRVWGPAGAIDIMHHRLRGFLLYLGPDHPGSWLVSEIGERRITSARFNLADSFETRYMLDPADRGELLIDEPGFSVSPILLDHGTVSIGYVVREKELSNVEVSRLAQLDLSPGPWLQTLKDATLDDTELLVLEGRPLTLGELRAKLLVKRSGDSFAYLTDFQIRDDTELARIAAAIKGCGTLVCESQYLGKDLALAQANHHMTAALAAKLAAHAQVGKQILFHISERYRRHDMPAFLDEAREIFEATCFPETWNIEG